MKEKNLLNNLRNFNETFRKDATYDDNKSCNVRRFIFGKTTGGGEWKLTQSSLLLKVKKTGNSIYIYRNELDKGYFQQHSTYGDFA